MYRPQVVGWWIRADQEPAAGEWWRSGPEVGRRADWDRGLPNTRDVAATRSRRDRTTRCRTVQGRTESDRAVLDLMVSRQAAPVVPGAASSTAAARKNRQGEDSQGDSPDPVDVAGAARRPAGHPAAGPDAVPTARESGACRLIRAARNRVSRNSTSRRPGVQAPTARVVSVRRGAARRGGRRRSSRLQTTCSGVVGSGRRRVDARDGRRHRRVFGPCAPNHDDHGRQHEQQDRTGGGEEFLAHPSRLPGETGSRQPGSAGHR